VARRVALGIVASLVATFLGPVSAHAGPGLPFPLGSVRFQERGDPSCPLGFTCRRFTVTCPDVKADATGLLAERSPDATPRGVVVFFNGGDGTQWWGNASPEVTSFFDALAQHGLELVVVRWRNGWLEAEPGEQVGPARLGCRPATITAWIHDQIYLPMGASPAPGACGFCLTGNSGGASQVAYALSHYGLGAYVGVTVMTSGPPHTALAAGCAGGGAAQRELLFDRDQARRIDASYGYLNGGGPCERHDSSWVPSWSKDGADDGARVYPVTRVEVIVGANDSSTAVPHAQAWARALKAAGQHVAVQTIPSMAHDVESSSMGLTALRDTLLASGGAAAAPAATAALDTPTASADASSPAPQAAGVTHTAARTIRSGSTGSLVAAILLALFAFSLVAAAAAIGWRHLKKRGVPG